MMTGLKVHVTEFRDSARDARNICAKVTVWDVCGIRVNVTVAKQLVTMIRFQLNRKLD